MKNASVYKMVNGKNKTVDTVLYEKNIGEKSYYVVQAIPDTKAKTLYIVTAFIGKEGYKKEAPQLINAKSLDVTAKTGSVDTSTKVIPQDSDSVKRKLSDRGSNSVSNRALLANALESTVQNEIEHKAITEYKAELARADALEQELAGIRSLWRCKKGAFSSCSYAEWKRISSCRHKNTELQNGVSVTKSAVESPISSVSKEMIQQKPNSVNTSKKKLSDRDSESVSNRALLANALDSTVQNEDERKAITKYKAELAQADALEQELAGIRSLWQCKKRAFSSCSYAEWKRISSCRHKNTELQNGVSVTKSAVESPISSVSKEMIQQKPNSVVFNLKQNCLHL